MKLNSSGEPDHCAPQRLLPPELYALAAVEAARASWASISSGAPKTVISAAVLLRLKATAALKTKGVMPTEGGGQPVQE